MNTIYIICHKGSTIAARADKAAAMKHMADCIRRSDDKTGWYIASCPLHHA